MGASAKEQEQERLDNEQVKALMRSVPAGEFPPEVKRELELRRMRNLVVSKIAGMSWGSGLDHAARAALADYGERTGIDVVTEIHILGGRIYKNAEYFMNRAQPYIRSGLIEYLRADHVHADARLDALAKSDDKPAAERAKQEAIRRAEQRVQHNIPEKAAAAVVARVRLRGHSDEFTAAKWCGGGTRQKDPVGDSAPVETAETRAIRRVLRLIVGYIPRLQQEVALAEDDEVLHVTEVIDASRDALRKADANQLSAGHVGHAVPTFDSGKDDYTREPVEHIAARPGAIKATADDPYAMCPECGGVDDTHFSKCSKFER